MVDRTNANGWDNLQKEVAQQTEAKPNPGLDPVTAAHNNMRGIVEKLSGATLAELTVLRDEIDNLMIAIRNRDNALIESIVQHAEFCKNAIQTKQIVNDSIKTIQNDFNGKSQMVTVEK